MVRHGSDIRAQILIEGLPADTELSGQLGFRLSCFYAPPQCSGLFVGERLLGER
ncbi:hypothetical protein GCM10011348_29240 [Marinobacterium nitratireducens]|uniref:Uncharacterized protein n=1 Tax=Marinobacterium nitratireducens TaxID=518897 RepID=A0A918DUP1_9GAMM|nr:hypothetical protein GCM10011348_29240 [Marinobacterium nitratireducens]